MRIQPFFTPLLLLVSIILSGHLSLSAQDNVMIGTTTYETIGDPSFEHPGTWTFTGVAAQVDYPTAPTGSKVLGIRGMATANQTITIPEDGCFRFDIQAAQYNAGGNLGFRINIDGMEVLEAVPPGTSFAPYYSVAFSLPAGSYDIQIAGTFVTSFALLFDDIRLAKLPCWSETTSWSQGAIPDATDTAIINSTDALVLDTIAVCSNLRTMGQFLAANNLDLSLDAEMIEVMMSGGLLEWGQVNTPYEANGTITLIGDIAQAQVDQSAALMVMDGAELQLHGAERDSWTQLNAHANQGDTLITLEKAMDWQVGDSIVIASTDFDPHQAEVRAISQVSGGGTVFHFTTPLAYNHYGELQTFPASPSTSVLDQRAEVGLLTRNLKIRGDADSHLDKAGGHVMVMVGSFAQVSGVEFFQMGQEGVLGRYPFHWHLTGDLTGQYIKNSSIHLSFNRVLTVHSSSNGLIEDNVAYDHIGNGYFLENGDELNNQFIHNLGVLTRAAKPGKEVRVYDRLEAEGGAPFLRLPATFWITHPTNDFVGNSAAGSEGSGFWMVVQDKPIEGSNPLGIFPYKAPMGQFDDNISHSTSFSNLAIDLRIKHHPPPIDTHEVINSGPYTPTNPPVVNNFTSYKCSDRAIWMRTHSLDFDSCASADNGRSTFFSYHNVIRNSLYVGKSDNVGTPSAWSASETSAGRSLPYPPASDSSLINHFRGHPLYDGPSGLENCHFANFTDHNSSIFSPNTAATKSTVHFGKQFSFTNVPLENKFSHLFSKDKDFQWTTGFIDQDGTLDSLTNAGDFVKPKITGPADADRRLYDEGFNVEVGATYVPEWDHYICTEEHYGLLIMENNLNPSVKIPMYSIRSDGPATITEGQDNKNQIPVIVSNPNYRYYLQFHRNYDELEFRLKFLRQDDVVVLVLLNVPTTTILSKPGGSISPFADLDAFEASNNEGYFFDDNTLYLRLKGTSMHTVAQFGDEFPYTSVVKVCQYANCQQFNPVGTFEVPMADYENGLDERATLSSSGNLTLSSITADLPSASNSFSITSDGDGIDEYIQYKLNFHRQAWSEFNNLELDYNGPRIEVLLHDESEGNVPLGFYQSTTCDGIDLTRLSKEEVDQVDALLIRVRESDLGSLSQSGLSDTVQLNEILLDYSRDLWDFHRTREDWKAVPFGSLTIDVVNEGFLYYNMTGGSSYMTNDLFKGKPTVKPEDNPYVVMRMKHYNTTATYGLFRHHAWGSSFGATPPENYDLQPQGVFNNYVIQPSWTSFNTQRVRFDLLRNTTSGEAEIDYIRLTACPTCYNGVQDGSETDIDCGGPNCPACPCEDGIQNNGETGIDCGGPCQPCSQLVFERGIVTGVTDSWVTVNLTNTYANPVVVATPKVISVASSPVVTRIQNIDSTSFELRVQNPGDGNTGSHNVHYFVVESGIYTQAIDGIDMEVWTENSDSTAGSGNWIFENRSTINSYTNPVILGQIQTYNDTRWSAFWASETGVRNAPPAPGNSFSAGKHVAQDTATTRSDEIIGFIAVEAGMYELNNLLVQAGVGTDVIRGTQDAQTIPLIPYFVSNQIKLKGAILSSAAMDGTDGGWPVLFTNNPIQNNRMYLAIDEDTIVDTERSHTTEQVAYLAFGSHERNPGPWQYEYQVELQLRNQPSNPQKTDQAVTFTLYPNPVKAGQRILLESTGPHSIDLSGLTIVNAEGKVQAYEALIESDQQVALEAQLPPGMYFVHFTDRDIRTVKKLIVTRD